MKVQQKILISAFLLVFLSSLILVTSVGASPRKQTTPTPLLVGFYGASTSPAALGMQVAIQEINELGPITGSDGQQYSFVPLVTLNPTELASATFVLTVPNDAAPETALTFNMPVFMVSEDAPLTLPNIQAAVFRAMTPQLQQDLALASFISVANTERITLIGDETTVGAQIETFNQVLLQGDTTGTLLVQRMNAAVPDDTQMQEILSVNPQVVVYFGAPENVNGVLAALSVGQWQGVFVYEDAFEARRAGLLGEVPNVQIIGVDSWVNSATDRLSAAFTSSFLLRTGFAPLADSVSAYDTTWAMKLMIERVGVDPQVLVGALPTTDVITTTQGRINVAAYGNNELFRSAIIYNLLPLGGTEVLARYDGGVIVDEEAQDDTALIPSATPQPSATPNNPILTVIVDVVNIRRGPGLNYDRVGRMNDGQQAPILGTVPDFSWFYIQAPFGLGWVSAEFVSVFTPSGTLAGIPLVEIPPSPTPAPATATPAPSAPADLVIDSVSLNPARPISGQQFTATIRVRNAGQAATPGFAVAASWMPGSVFSSVILQPLQAGETRDVVLQATVNGSAKPTVAVIADLNSEVAESNEGNNQFNITYTVDAVASFAGTSQAINSTDIDIDGGGAEFSWTAGGGTVTVTPTAGVTVGLINGFSFEDAYAGLLTAGAITGVAPINVTVGTGLFGIRTANGHCGVLRVENTAGTVITLSFRYYPIAACA